MTMLSITTHEVKWFHRQLGKHRTISDTHFRVYLKAVASTMCQMIKILMAFPGAGRDLSAMTTVPSFLCHLRSNDPRKSEILFFNTLFSHGHLEKNIYFLFISPLNIEIVSVKTGMKPSLDGIQF